MYIGTKVSCKGRLFRIRQTITRNYSKLNILLNILALNSKICYKTISDPTSVGDVVVLLSAALEKLLEDMVVMILGEDDVL
jgi:hypothetical protein